MKRASDFLNTDEQQAVEKAVIAAERKTSVEIVPVVATASGRYDRAEDMAGLWLGGVLMVAMWLLWPLEPNAPGDWSAAIPWNYAGWIGALVAGFVAGAVLASRTGWLRRLFSTKREMVEEVERRAREAFFDQRIHHTEGATGVLIYVSIYERLVCVLADAAVQKVLPDGEVQRLCDELTKTLGTTPADGLARVIGSLGDTLSEPLPRAADDVDELANAVVLID